MRSRLTTAERRNQILTAASRLIRENGYHVVGMRDIAEAVGIRGPSLYKHFDSKIAILEAIVESVTTDFIEERIDALVSGAPVAPQLRALVVEQLIYLAANGDALTVADHDLLALPEESVLRIQGQRRRYQRAITTLIKEGVESRELSSSDPNLAGYAFFDMINGAVRWFRPRGDLERYQLAERYSHIIVDDMLGPVREVAPAVRIGLGIEPVSVYDSSGS